MKPCLMALPTFEDERGRLTVVEHGPFEVKRAFWIHGATQPRGQHSHRKGEQLIIAVNGSFVVHIENKEIERNWILSNPTIGVLLPPGYWVELKDFTEDAVALVLCSHYYEENVS